MTMFEIKQEAENLLTLAYNQGRRDGIKLGAALLARLSGIAAVVDGGVTKKWIIEEAKRQQKALENMAAELEVGK